MIEYLRTKYHQYTDVELVMILDTVTGEPIKFGNQDSIGTLKDAITFLKTHIGRQDRTVIVKLQCIRGFKLK